MSDDTADDRADDRADDGVDDRTDEQVRRLLADAHGSPTVPPEVSARLDGVLAGLVAERASAGRDATVVPLAPRRRRTATWAAAAAAVLVLGGVALGQVLPGAGPDGDTADMAQSDSSGTSSQAAPDDRDGSAGAAELAPPGPALADRRDGSGAPEGPGAAAVAPEALVELGVDSFEADVLALRALGGGRTSTLLADGRCTGAPGRGETFTVSYADEPASLVLRPATAAGQRAELFRCGARTPLRSALLPAP